MHLPNLKQMENFSEGKRMLVPTNISSEMKLETYLKNSEDWQKNSDQTTDISQEHFTHS